VLAGPDGLKGTTNDVLVAGDIQMFRFPLRCSAADGPRFGPHGGRVLELANRALAVLPTGGASLSDINAAVDAINRGFDECRAPVIARRAQSFRTRSTIVLPIAPHWVPAVRLV